MSTTEILTKVTLQFNETDLYRMYLREKTIFFKRSLIILTIFILLLCIGIEIVYAQLESGLSLLMRIINWSCLFVILMITVFHTKLTKLHLLVCPVLTIFGMMCICFTDYDLTMQSVFYS